MRRNIKLNLFYLFIALLALYTLTGFFLIPWVVKSQMLKRLPDLLNREVALEKVSFNPYTLTGQLQRFQVTDHDGQVFLSLEGFKGNFQLSSIFRKGFRLKEVSLQEPYLRIQRNADATLNFSDLIPVSSGEDSLEDGEETDKGLPVVHINQFSIQGGVFVVQDQSPNSHYNKEIRDINFTVDDLSTDPETTGLFTVAALSETAETFTWTGELNLIPLSVTGEMVVEYLDLPKFMPYVEHLLAGKVESGVMSTRLNYVLRLDEGGIDLVVEEGFLSLDNFSLKTHDASEALIAWDTFNLGGFSMDLLSGQVVVNSIAFSGISVLAHRHEDGEFNFGKAYIPPAREIETSEAGSQLLPEVWNFHVEGIEVADTSLHIVDESLATPADLNVQVPLLQVFRLSNSEDQKFTANLELIDTTGGAASLSGEGSLVPAQGEFVADLANWDLTVLNPFISEFANIDLLSAYLAMNGSINFALEDGIPTDLSFSGGFEFSDFSSQDSNDKSPLSSWTNLAVKGIEFDYPARRLDIESIDYLNPKAGAIIQEDGSINFARLLKPRDIQKLSTLDLDTEESPQPEEPSEPVVQSEELHISVETFSINNGYFSFEDRQQTPHVILTSEAITGSAKGLSSDLSARPTFEINTQVMGITPLTIDGNLNLLASQPYIDLSILLKGLEMTPFAPYFTRYVGYYLEKGILNLDLSYKVEEQQLQAENQIVVNQLTLGDSSESPDATGLPVPLAVSLLKDASGDIEIDVPIRGDLSDPEFKLGGVILRTISNLILKLASSPFNMLAKLANVSAEELETVAFKQGDFEIGEASMVNLDALALAMEERPGIRLEISVAIDPALETPALVKKQLMADLERNFAIDPNLDLSPEEAYQQRIEKAYRKEQLLIDKLQELPPFQEMESSLLANIDVNQNDLAQLAQQRKQSIRNYLVSSKGIAPERILIVEDKSLDTNDSGLSVAKLSIM